MAGLFLQNDFMNPLFNLLISNALAQFGAKVMLGDTEEASPDLPIGRQPQPIAMTTKRFAHRGNDPQFATTIGERPAFGRLGRIRRRERTKLKSSLQALEDFAP